MSLRNGGYGVLTGVSFASALLWAICVALARDRPVLVGHIGDRLNEGHVVRVVESRLGVVLVVPLAGLAPGGHLVDVAARQRVVGRHAPLHDGVRVEARLARLLPGLVD